VLHANLEDYCAAPHTRTGVGTKFQPLLVHLTCSTCRRSYTTTNGFFLCRVWASLPGTFPRGRNGTPAAKSPTFTPFQHKLQPVNPIPARRPSRNPQPNLRALRGEEPLQSGGSYLQELEPSSRPEVDKSTCRARLKKNPRGSWLFIDPLAQPDRRALDRIAW
jgi:hypothetical protein